MTLTLDTVAKTFPGGTKAVQPSSLIVAAGEIVALLGPSGCGKSTLLRMIAGLERPDPGGRVLFGDDDVTAQPVEQRQAGMVFQSYALFPNMNVRANVGYGLKMLGLPRPEIAARVDEVLALCRLEPYADRAVSALSGGQRQRVALARAVAPRPRILLLDEPLSALDASLREELRDELAGLLRRFGITAIFVTHDQSEALAIADRVAVMRDGWIEQVATAEEIYRRPASAFVAEFVGRAQALQGDLRDGHLHLPGGALPLPKARPGGALRVFVRAEDVAVDPAGPLQARVAAASFLGTHTRLQLTGAAPGVLHATHRGASVPVPGMTLRLSIPPEALILLPAEPHV